MTPPATWDELLTVVDTLKENDIIPFALANKTKWTSSMYYMYLVDRLGGPEVFANAATRSGGSFEDPIFVQAGEMVQELVNMDAFNEGFNGLDYDTGQSRQLLYSGKAAMELMGNWQIATMRAENPDFEANNLGFFPFPAIEGGAGDPSNVVGTVGDNYYSISTACENPDEAFEMIQYLIDDEAVPLLAADGRIPPVKGFTTDDPALQEIIDLIGNAAQRAALVRPVSAARVGRGAQGHHAGALWPGDHARGGCRRSKKPPPLTSTKNSKFDHQASSDVALRPIAFSHALLWPLLYREVYHDHCSQRSAKSSRQRTRTRRVDEYTLTTVLFLLPTVLALFIFVIWPICRLPPPQPLQVERRRSRRRPFVGLENWTRLVQGSASCGGRIRNNFIIVFASIVIQLPIGLGLAMLLDRGGRKMRLL